MSEVTRSVEIPEAAVVAAANAALDAGFVDPDDGTIPQWYGEDPIPVWTHPSEAVKVILAAALPYLAPAGAEIQMVDVAAEAREMYGEHADEIAGRRLPEHEWRFELLFSDGARATMHHGATADDVQAYLAMMRNEGKTLQSAPAVPQPVDREALAKAAHMLYCLKRDEATHPLDEADYNLADEIIGALGFTPLAHLVLAGEQE